VNKNQTPGDYHVNYVPSVAGLENATYYYQLSAGNTVIRRKMIRIE
jgi:hypothetical protein